MATMWQCEDCGWTCSPNPAIPLEEAECDNCGGELIPADTSDASARNA